MGVYAVRMARVNVTIPDEVIERARAAGVNVSRVATEALLDELDRREKRRSLDEHLAEMDRRLGPVSSGKVAEAVAWADEILEAEPVDARPAAVERPQASPRRSRRSA